MIQFDAVPLDFEPRRKIFTLLPKDSATLNAMCLMTEFDTAFLCGALKKFRPKKILELGVAGGATTAIILQALEELGTPYEMHSIDISPNFLMEGFLDKACGFVATFAKEKIFGEMRGTHTFHLGKYLPQVIDSIGGDIDFVILDTVQLMPGEGLDFLAVLPYLTADAVVVLHDVSYNQLAVKNVDTHATTALFSAVAAEKFLNFQPDSELFHYPNIAAFQVNGQTRDNIENVFLSLILRWSYLPSQAELVLYREHYRRFYPAELCAIFQEAIDMNAYNFYIMQHK